MNNFEYVRKYYKVPAELGRRVKIDGRPGIIIEDMGNYIGVNFDDTPPNDVRPCHPTWKAVYLDMGTPRKMTRSQRRYREFLKYGDCYDDFHDFLLHHKEART